MIRVKFRFGLTNTILLLGEAHQLKFLRNIFKTNQPVHPYRSPPCFVIGWGLSFKLFNLIKVFVERFTLKTELLP